MYIITYRLRDYLSADVGINPNVTNIFSMNFFQWMNGRNVKFVTKLVWLNHEDWRREETASKRSSFVGIGCWWFVTKVSCRRSNVGIQLVSRASSWIGLAVEARFLVCGQLDGEEKKRKFSELLSSPRYLRTRIERYDALAMIDKHGGRNCTKLQ